MYFYEYFSLFNVVVSQKTANISLTKKSNKIMTKIQFKCKFHSELKKHCKKEVILIYFHNAPYVCSFMLDIPYGNKGWWLLFRSVYPINTIATCF